MISLMEELSILHKMDNNLKANGKIILKMGMEFINGLMGVNMKEIILKVREMDSDL